MKKLLAVLLSLVLMIGILPATAFAAEFSDVPQDLYCYDAVNWAVSNGITKGVDATHFGPKTPCIRRHVMMFLWRSMGCPEPASMKNPFIDVKHDSFLKPILWGYYAGITTGKDAWHFNPEGICNRKQIVTFLWRAKGCPETNNTAGFPDVKYDRFAKPIYWAAEHGITGGYKDGTFRPEATCTRGQIVTFLYRADKLNSNSGGHIHSYTATIVEPTCTEEGYTVHACICGESYKDNFVEATGHTWTSATCTSPKTCTVCGATEGSALGHNYVDGYCIRCGEKDPNAVSAGQQLANFICARGNYDSKDNTYTYLYTIHNNGSVSISGMTYDPYKNTIWFGQIFSSRSGDSTLGFNYSVSQMTNADNLGLMFTTSNGSKMFAMADFDMGTYSSGDYLYFYDSYGHSYKELNKMGSSCMELGILGWATICGRAGLSIQDIGFYNVSFRARSMPRPMLGSGQTETFCDEADVAVFQHEYDLIKQRNK